MVNHGKKIVWSSLEFKAAYHVPSSAAAILGHSTSQLHLPACAHTDPSTLKNIPALPFTTSAAEALPSFFKTTIYHLQLFGTSCRALSTPWSKSKLFLAVLLSELSPWFITVYVWWSESTRPWTLRVASCLSLMPHTMPGTHREWGLDHPSVPKASSASHFFHFQNQSLQGCSSIPFIWPTTRIHRTLHTFPRHLFRAKSDLLPQAHSQVLLPPPVPNVIHLTNMYYESTLLLNKYLFSLGSLPSHGAMHHSLVVSLWQKDHQLGHFFNYPNFWFVCLTTISLKTLSPPPYVN